MGWLPYSTFHIVNSAAEKKGRYLFGTLLSNLVNVCPDHSVLFRVLIIKHRALIRNCAECIFMLYYYKIVGRLEEPKGAVSRGGKQETKR